MNPTTQATEGNASAPALYMALELSNRSWRLALGCAVAKAKERFKMPASARVVSCYEAGRDDISSIVRRQTGTEERENDRITRRSAAWGR